MESDKLASTHIEKTSAEKFEAVRKRGRPPGAKNKMQKAAKEAIAEAAEKLGGTNRLVEWAKEDPANERAFWVQVYPKLLPLQVTGEGGGPLKISRIELVALTNADGKD